MQILHEEAVDLAGVDPARRVRDRKSGVDISDGGCAHAEYVDNYLVASHNKSASITQGDNIKQVLNNARLVVHEVEAGIKQCDYVGLRINGETKQVSATPTKIWRVYLGVKHLLKFKYASSHEIECLVGHCTWILLLRRECLSILRRCIVSFKRVSKGASEFGMQCSESCDGVHRYYPCALPIGRPFGIPRSCVLMLATRDMELCGVP